MSEPDLLVATEGAVATLTLNRPSMMNALSLDMAERGLAALRAFAEDDAIRVVVLTGAGPAFCAGGDVAQMQAAVDGRTDYHQTLKQQYLIHEFARLLHDMPKVTVAAIDGPAFGAGLSLALATDLRLASDKASFGTAFASVGLDGDLGISWTLPRLVGEAKAKELMFLPGKLSAAQAKELGLVNFLVKAEDYAAELAKLTGRLAAGPMNALRFIKANINASHAEGLAATLDREATSHVSLMSDADFHEGVRAFLGKRAPVFR